MKCGDCPIKHDKPGYVSCPLQCVIWDSDACDLRRPDDQCDFTLRTLIEEAEALVDNLNMVVRLIHHRQIVCQERDIDGEGA